MNGKKFNDINSFSFVLSAVEGLLRVFQHLLVRDRKIALSLAERKARVHYSQQVKTAATAAKEGSRLPSQGHRNEHYGRRRY
jgi:hypothetical protein